MLFRSATGLPLGQAFAAMRFMRRLEAADFRVQPDRSVQRFLAEHGQHGSVLAHLWEPLCVSALNTPADVACARTFSAVLRDSLTRRSLIMRKNMGTKKIARKVAAIMPPMTPVPTDWRAPAPAPVENASGATPRMKAMDVMRMGQIGRAHV